MGERKASNQKHLSQVTIAEFEAEAEVNHLEDNVGRHLNIVKGGAGPPVEGLPTVPATVNWVAQSCSAIELRSTFGPAVGAGHGLRDGGGSPLEYLSTLVMTNPCTQV